MTGEPSADSRTTSGSEAVPRGVNVAVEPKSGRYESLEDAVRAGGGTVVPPGEAEALVWADPRAADQFPTMLAQATDARWIALPFAGIERYVPHLTPLDGQGRPRTWTAAKRVYAEPVAEHALMLALAGMRGLGLYARATGWERPVGVNLLGARVVIFGGGGITESFLRLLEPFGCHTTVLRRRVVPMDGVDHVSTVDDRLAVLAEADLVVLALALTEETRQIIGAEELAAMPDHCWIVNVARGGHIDTDALVRALADEQIGGAALDVTDPEPLPDGHPLWSDPRALITPHVGNTPDMGIPLLARHIADNVARFAAGSPLEGEVDVEAGY